MGGLRGRVFAPVEVWDAIPELPALDTLDRASAAEVAAERATYE